MNMEIGFSQLCDEISGMIRDLKRVVIAIDGMACAGKTHLAQRLAAHFPHTVVIGMDSFYLPRAQRTEERMAQPGGHMDTVRFAEQVAMPLWKADTPTYTAFDCRTQTMGQPIACDPAAELYIVEGTYATHPEIPDIYDLRIFVECDPAVRDERLVQREGEGAEAFARQWIVREQTYFAAYMTKELADFCFDGGRPDEGEAPADDTQADFENLTELLPYRKGENEYDDKA